MLFPGPGQHGSAVAADMNAIGPEKALDQVTERALLRRLIAKANLFLASNDTVINGAVPSWDGQLKCLRKGTQKCTKLQTS